MITHKKNLLILGITFLFISAPIILYAKIDATQITKDTIKKVTEDKFLKETGLNEVKDISEIDIGKIADKTVEYISPEVPSPVMESLLIQISRGRDIKTEALFKPFIKKRPNIGDVSTRPKQACELAANGKMQSGMFNGRVNAHFGPWVGISWDIIKTIAGGKGLADFITEKGKAKAEESIKEFLFGKTPPKIETATINHHDECNTVTKVTWDPINMRIIIVTNGDCKCSKLIKTDNGNTLMKGFRVALTAPVTVDDVKIGEKNYFIFWRKYNIKAKYKVHKLKVATKANCNCAVDIPPPPPPPPPKNKIGIIGRIIDWLFGFDDNVSSKGKKHNTDKIIQKDNDKKDKNQKDREDVENKDAITDRNIKNNGNKIKENESKKETGNKTTSKTSLACGDRVSIDGRDNVPTYSYRTNGELNKYCNNSCLEDEVCKVVPQSVGAYNNSCVYCAKKVYVKKDDKILDREPTKCEIPSKQHWNNAFSSLNFKSTQLDNKRVLVENAGTYCGMNTLAEFKDYAQRNLKFVSGQCQNVYADDFKYTDIRGKCSFIAYFEN